MRNVVITNAQSDFPIDERIYRKALERAASYHKIAFHELSLQFVDTPTICKLHEEFFDDPSTTDCISFPIDPPGEDALLGEIFVCPQTAIEYAAHNNTTPEKEILLYTLHGFLHLIGYDDREESDRKEMREQEALLLAQVD